MWFSWESQKAFDIWHEDTCALLGLPKPGRNSLTGEVDTDAQWTTRYTDSFAVAKNDFRAFVEDEIVALSPNLLGKPSESPSGASDIID